VSGVSQEEFIRTVREAIGTRRDVAERPADYGVARVVSPDGPIVEKFCEMVLDARMQLHRVGGPADVPAAVLAIMKQHGVRSAIVSEEAFPGREALRAAMEAAGCELLDLRAPDAPFEADLGITAARLAIAETGSIVVRSGPDVRRIGSLAVPVHVSIVPRERIVPDLMDWAAALGPDMPSNEVLITGPSKTSDIEMKLVVGVHGPRHVHVVLVG